MPDNDHNFESLESQEVELLRALRAIPRPEASSELTLRVMDEVAVASTLKEAKPTDLVGDAFSSDVMARLGETPQARTTRLPSYISHIGVAVASLLFALVLWPIFSEQDKASESTDGGNLQAILPEPETPLVAAKAPLPTLAAFETKVRDITSYQGHPAVILSAGLVEGLRVADSLELKIGDRLVPLRVQALSSWMSIATYPPGTRGVERNLIAQAAAPTPRMRESMRNISEGTTPQGVYFGLGIVVEERNDGLYVRELIPRIWHESRNEDLPSRAAELGLQRGDRIDSALGLAVTNDQSFVAALSHQRLREGRLRLTITRKGQSLDLHEAKSTRR